MRLFSAVFILVGIFTSCVSQSIQKEAESSKADFTVSADLWVDSVMNNLTLEEKIGQFLMPSIMTVADSATYGKLREYVADYHIGGIVLLGGELESAKRIINLMEEISHLPVFIAVDGEWGLAMRFPEAPEFPPNSKLTEADDQLMYEYGYEIGRECGKLGINMLLGPVLDVSSASDFMAERSLGADPVKVADLGIAYARGVEDGSVMSVAKHFPGHGSTKTDSHKALPKVNRNRVDLDKIDLLPFRRYIANGLSGIMAGHLYMPSLDTVERSATVSPVILTCLLRTQLGFKGLVLSDALNMLGAGGASALDAVKNGADIVLSPSNTTKAYEDILEAVRKGKLAGSVIDDRCRRILFYKYRFARNYKNNTEGDSITTPETRKLQKKLLSL